ncbi:hypothetical protein AVEN_64744-1, partial [Araneus ventricosus]
SSHSNVTTTYFRRQREITNYRRQVAAQCSVYKGCPRASESISIVGVMQKRSDLSDVQKGMIIGFRAKGGSISEAANFVNCSRAAVVKVYRAWQYGTIQNQRRGTCGAPRAVDDRGERRLRRCVRANRRATVEQLTAQMNQGATKSVSSTHLSLRTMSTPTCELFFLRMMASTSRTMRGVIQLAVYVRGSKSTRMSLPYSLASKLTGFKPNRESVGPPRSGCSRHGSSTA